MFTKRELYIIASCLFDRKNSLVRKDQGSEMTVSEFDEYFELSTLHLKIKDLINER